MFARIGIIGSGAMGRGIAQLFATAGQEVWLHDSRPEAIDQALAFNRGLLERAVAKGSMSAETLAGTLARMRPAHCLQKLADCDLLIEAIVENLEAKQALFRKLKSLVAQDVVLTTNTSSLSVARIASTCQYPQRVAGFHFFNPVPRMKIVEVVKGPRTDGQVISRLAKLAEHAGHFAAITPDTPGFLVNHAGRAYGTEALRILSEGIATPAQIDRILRDTGGFRMGPFELFDLIGLDISQATMESIFQQFYHDPRYTPSYQVPQRLAAGLLGRKSGQGFYCYVNGHQVCEPETVAVEVSLDRPFWLHSAGAALRQRLRALFQQTGATLEEAEQPSAQAICLITPLGADASTLIARQQLPAERTLALETFAGFDKRRVLMRQPALAPVMLAQTRQALAADGVPVEVINDSPGFITQRVIASIVNLGCEIAQKCIATPGTLDCAVQLALGYPRGPLSFGDHFGAACIQQILEELHAAYQEARYRPSPWLRRRVQLGLPLTTPEEQEEEQE